MNSIAKLSVGVLCALLSSISAAQSSEADIPERKPLWGGTVMKEAFNRQILQKGQAAPPLVAGDFPRAVRLNSVKMVGALTTVEHGLHKIGKQPVIFANVDWRDRGYVKEATAFLAKFENQPAEAYCHVEIWGGSVCDVFAKDKDSGKEVNLSEELLRNGWYGWQMEMAGAASFEAGRAATEAYWARRGVWSNPWYFPSASGRNAHAKISLVPAKSVKSVAK